jgi:NAD(P)-dependent dehydrogenase (short-subunit alcohol dehydrogenase family)
MTPEGSIHLLELEMDPMMSLTHSEVSTQIASASGRLLENKVAIITGASRGIGAAAARTFARAGASVVLAARDEPAMASVAQEIVAAGGQALVVPTDVGDPASVEQLVRRTLETYGRLDAAFNNAGDGHMPTALADIAVDDFDRVLRVNLRGVFLVMKFEIPAMLESGGGAIINMSSTAGLSGVRGIASYAAAKHGIIGLTKSAALDYAQQNIRVNAVAPGPILTDRIRQLREEAREPIIRAVPMGRIGQAEEVGALAAWLCSDQAAFLTGAAIPIDGGRLAGGA